MYSSLITLQILLIWIKLVRGGYSAANLEPYSLYTCGISPNTPYGVYDTAYSQPVIYNYPQYPYNSYPGNDPQPVVVIVNGDDDDKDMDFLDIISLISTLRNFKNQGNQGPVYVPYPVPVCNGNHNHDNDCNQDCACRNTRCHREEPSDPSDCGCNHCANNKKKAKCHCSGNCRCYSDCEYCNNCGSVRHLCDRCKTNCGHTHCPSKD